MKTLIVFNTVVNLVILWMLIKHATRGRVEFRVLRTFFQKKPYGFEIVLWKCNRHHSSWNTGRTISLRVVPDRLSDSAYGEEKTSIVSSMIEGYGGMIKQFGGGK